MRNCSVDRRALRLFHDETPVAEIPDIPLQRNISVLTGSPGERLTLVPEITVGGIPQLWIHTCAQMLEPLRWDHSGSLFSAKKRSLGLERGTWRILAAGCSPEARRAALEEAMEDPNLQHERWGSSCRDYLENVVKLVASWDATVLQASPHESLPAFLTFSQAEVKGLEALGLVGWHLTKGGDETPKLVIGKDTVAFTARQCTVAEALPDLKADCDDRGIELRVDDGPIETVSLQIDIVADAVQVYDGSDHRRIDFFELHPEVCCDGFEIPAGRWRELITGGLLQPPAGSGAPLRLIDSASRRLLARVRAMHRPTDDDGPPSPIPRLQIFDWFDLVKQGANLRLPPSEQAVIDSLRSGELDHRAPLPTRLLAELRPYQEAGYKWLAYLYRHRFGGILADDMGLGKTLQAIGFLAGLKEGQVAEIAALGNPAPSEKRPHLIVLPPTLLFNWAAELARFYPDFLVYEYVGSRRAIGPVTRADVVLTSYDLVRRDLEKLKAIRFDVLIFDEAQAAKNYGASRSKAIRQLDARFRICLTGTPMENHVGEYFSVVELALPGIFGDRTKFMAQAKDNPDAPVVRRARPFVLRRTKDRILNELPPKIESDTRLEMTRLQREIYTRTVAEVRSQVETAYADKPSQQAGIVALAALTRLRQVCISPAILDPAADRRDAPKIAHLVSSLRELAAEGHAALVFSQFVTALDILQAELAAGDHAILRIDGSVPTAQRKHLVESFQDGTGPSTFLISLKTGGAGLNLTRASYVFHLDPWWNPAVENQASDRAHRIGQTGTVFVHRLIMRNTIEEKMMLLKKKKQKIADQILDRPEDAAPLATGVTESEIRELLGIS